MAEPRVIGVIPVRWASSRFPGKALATLAGRPLVEHVHRRAARARSLDRLLVATDDERIARVVSGFGGEVVRTAADHASGTDRVAEVAASLAGEIVVNIQGDEALLDPAAVDAAVAPLQANPDLDASTLAAPLADDEAMVRPDVVKVVVDLAGRALYFSRWPVPYARAAAGGLPPRVLHHVGLYAYRRSFLLELARWAPTPLELSEGLEQLRVLEHGRRMQVVEVAGAHPGVDTPADLARVEQFLAGGSP